jgi:hypothetical protein
LLGTVFFGYQAYKLGKIVINVQDSIETSLDVLDERYKSMNEILQKPVFFDSLEVRQVIEDISITRDAVLFIANQLVSAQEVPINDDKDGEKEESS